MISTFENIVNVSDLGDDVIVSVLESRTQVIETAPVVLNFSADSTDWGTLTGDINNQFDLTNKLNRIDAGEF